MIFKTTLSAAITAVASVVLMVAVVYAAVNAYHAAEE